MGTAGKPLFTIEPKISPDALLAHERLVENIQLRTFRQSPKNVAGNVYLSNTRVLEKN